MSQHQDSRSSRSHLKLALLLLLTLEAFAGSRGQAEQAARSEEPKPAPEGEPLLEEGSENSQLSASSHKVLAAGWPSTSPMWPSVESSAEAAAGTNSAEPFIYADRPRTNDYSLLLALNETVQSALKSRPKQMALNLSFDYYFNFEPTLAALPAIKIELDRKQYKHLEPNGQEIKARTWMSFRDSIAITEPSQFANRDWLKFSLVVRQSPSLVAVRRLRAEFVASSPAAAAPAQPGLQSTAPERPAPRNSAPQPSTPNAAPEVYSLSPAGSPMSPHRQQTPAASLPARQPVTEQLQPQFQPQYTPAGQTAPPGPNYAPEVAGPLETDEEQLPAASNIIHTTIKPVAPKRKGWNIWGKRRRRREAGSGLAREQTAASLVLSCFRSDACDWMADATSEPLQWSLARMPPSTSSVHSGYYYVSNRNDYGDASKLLRLSLNQTDSATIADQNSDHCLELALYVTERTHLKLYKLRRQLDENLQESFIKGNLLLTWAPTMMSEFLESNWSRARRRLALPKSRLLAAENDQNGWTMETLCFGDFFPEARECGSGNCYLGFEMDTEPQRAGQWRWSAGGEALVAAEQAKASPAQAAPAGDEASLPEQVVGVALLKEFSLNVPVRAARPRWLEAWQREEVEPSDNWRFYPKLDFELNANNLSLLNLFDDTHYYVESDWMRLDSNLELTGALVLDVSNFTELALNSSQFATVLSSLQADSQLQQNDDPSLFQLRMNTKLFDSNYEPIYANNSTLEWPLRSNQTATYSLGLPITERILGARQNQLGGASDENGLFKVAFEFVLSLNRLLLGGQSAPEDQPAPLEAFFANHSISYRFSLVNVSISDRCFPSPCQFGSCQQNGTGYEDWSCTCDEKHRGRRCEFGRWCSLAHVTPWQPPAAKSAPADRRQARQPKAVSDSIARITGREYCQRKLGAGFKCTELDLALNENLYTEEEKTFVCSCQSDFYLSDDARCKPAHLCNSLLCPSIGMTCDETKPFNRSQPCQCNEKLDWHPNPAYSPTSADQAEQERCVRHQCKDVKRDCGFEAHICLPTLPGERPICKCGPKFALRTDERGQKYCDSTACVLPTLNDCEHLCLKDNSNRERPFTCACHPGYELKPDKRGCLPSGRQKISCRPGCQGDTQICTEAGCKCKQGFIGEGELVVQRPSSNSSRLNATIEYVSSVKCLNVCALTYAENKSEFEMLESVCPLGLCDPTNFHCRCSDPSSSALINTKYEPIYANSSSPDPDQGERMRSSPLCHLRRVCEPNSSSYRICRSQGAICVPDYTKSAMFDCICPPSTEKKFYGQASSSEFTCEPKCSAKKYDCLRKQAVCKLVDKDQVRCDCLPGLMFDQADQKCYLAKYSYAFNLVIVNKYYEPESRFHKLLNVSNAEDQDGLIALKYYEASSRQRPPKPDEGHADREPQPLSELLPQPLQVLSSSKSIFIKDYNQCNITQVIPKAVIEDPYEHDVESYLSYIDQCNERIHQNVRTYHLNSRLSEDLRQSLMQHLREFTVTTNNSSCTETDPSGMYLNCTIYLQSNEVIAKETIEFVFNDCDKNAYQADKYCWIKPRLLLKKAEMLEVGTDKNQNNLIKSTDLNFKQIVPCEIDNFCGLDAVSVRLDDKTSLCSCKCPPDIEVIDVKELESGLKQHLATSEEDSSKYAIKEICAPRNHCGGNSTFCLGKTGSVCQYDIRLGSKCTCVYPSYEDAFGKCIEVTFSQLDNTLIVIIILLGTSLIVSLAINLAALMRSKSLFGRSKQYPLNEFPSTTTRVTRNHHNRSTGIPNPVFTND